MRRRPAWWLTMAGLAFGLGGCALAVSNTESRLTQAGFRKIAADTPKRAEHLQTIAPNKLIRRTTAGKSYFVYADPGSCQCLFVGDEVAYSRYKGLVRQQQEAAFLQEEREEEGFEGVK